MITEVKEILRKIRTKEIVGADDATLASAKALSILSKHSKTAKELRWGVKDVTQRLALARPSSASLRNFVSHVNRELNEVKGLQLIELQEFIAASVSSFVQKIREAKNIIGEIGSKLLRDGDVILSHGFSTTVLAILKNVIVDGKSIHVYLTEARPGFGGRTMARRLARMDIPVTLIFDSAIRVFINEIDSVLVGGEAIVVNGAVISKVGTAMIATLAHEARVRTLVAAGTYKLSPETVTGELVEIEEGDPTKVVNSSFLEKIKNLTMRNPLYDVTPPQYIDAIITEKGVVSPQAAYLVLRQMMEV